MSDAAGRNWVPSKTMRSNEGHACRTLAKFNFRRFGRLLDAGRRELAQHNNDVQVEISYHSADPACYTLGPRAEKF